MPKAFLLYVVGTPNGHKVTLFLEELKAQYPELDYDIQRVDIMKNEQKEPWFIALNPNGRIPVLVDHLRNEFVVFESAAILLYLQQHYDTANKFAFDSQSKEQSEMLQWIFFAHGGVGPIQGQLSHFNNWVPEDIPYAKKRFLDECRRVYNVLNIRLNGRDYLAGDKFSLADVNVWPWIRVADETMFGIGPLDQWPAVKAWSDRIAARPATIPGLIPLR